MMATSPSVGDLSLREADRHRPTPTRDSDTITFDPNVFTGGNNSLIRLTLGPLGVCDSLSIDGTLGRRCRNHR